MDVHQLHETLGRWQIPITRDERKIQDAIEDVLIQEAIPFQREFRLSSKDVIDFLIDDRIGLEVKTQGGVSAVIEQVWRYAQCDRIHGLLLMTTRRKHVIQQAEINGKPFSCLVIS